MKPTLLSIVSILVFFSAQAQQQNGSYSEYLSFEKRFNKVEMDLDGSPYLSDDWAPGYVLFTNNYKLEKVDLRFNAYYDELEVKLLNVEHVARPGSFKQFVYLDPRTNKQKTFKSVRLADGMVLILNILFEDKIIVGELNQSRRGRGPSSGSGSEVLNPGKDRLVLITTTYIVKDGVATKTVRNKKTFFKSLGDHADEIEAYAKKNHLDVKDDDDLNKIMAHYITL